MYNCIPIGYQTLFEGKNRISTSKREKRSIENFKWRLPPRRAAYGRIPSASATLCSDNQTLIAEIRKATMMLKETAVEFEKDNKSEMVKELEDGVLELVRVSDECTHLPNALI